MDKKRNNGEGGVNPGKVGHFSLLSQDKMLKRRDECTAGGQRKGWWSVLVMKEKNEAVIANTAIRALCCFRALSFEGCFFFFFCLTTELNLKIVSSKEKKEKQIQRETYYRYMGCLMEETTHCLLIASLNHHKPACILHFPKHPMSCWVTLRAGSCTYEDL